MELSFFYFGHLIIQLTITSRDGHTKGSAQKHSKISDYHIENLFRLG